MFYLIFPGKNVETEKHPSRCAADLIAILVLVLAAGILTGCTTTEEPVYPYWPMLSEIKWSRMDTEDLQQILNSGVSVNDTKEPGGYTALMFAAQLCPDQEVVRALLEAGADVSARTVTGETALMMAVVNPDPGTASLLIQAGADVCARNQGGLTALQVAVIHQDSPEPIGALLQAGAGDYTVNHGLAAPDIPDIPPLAAAVWKDADTRKAQELIQKGADVNSRLAGGLTPLMLAARNPQASGEMTALLLDAGAQVNDRSEYGTSALMHAAQAGKVPAIEGLIQAGARINARDSKRWTAGITAAVHSPSPQALRILLDAGADMDPQSDAGLTALMLAAGHNPSPEILQLLLDAGQDPNAQSQEGYTPLMFAAGIGSSPQVLRTLLDSGANPTAESASGKTAWELIQDNKGLKATAAYWDLRDAQLNS